MEHKEALQPDWKKIKEILCGISDSLYLVCESLPAGVLKSIICGIGGVMKLVCQSIPSSEK